MDFTKYQFSFGIHREQKVIWIQFPFTWKLRNDLKKQFPSVKFSQTNKAWYLPDFPSIRTILKLPLESLIEDKQEITHPENQKALQEFLNKLQQKAYSINTQKTYINEFWQLLHTLGKYPVEKLTPEKLKDYFLYCIKKQGIKERQLNSRINAIKFYFEKVLHREKMFFDIPRPKTPSTLPKMLSKSEVKKIFNATTNLKHQVILKLCYGMGLRVSEIVNLKIEDFNVDRRQVLIASAKGKKDRYVNLPETILPLLKEYYSQYQPKKWLFEGQYGDQYSKRSAQAIFKNAMKKAKINKTIGIHGLRHSYATHLLESGADLQFIKELLGQNRIKTTPIYTPVTEVSKSKIKSPPDTM